MTSGSEADFDTVRDNEWDCFVLHTGTPVPMRPTEGSVKRELAAEDRSMLASEAAMRFVEQHAATPKGECFVRVRSPLGEYDFVARVGWGELTCKYESSFEEWGRKSALA